MKQLIIRLDDACPYRDIVKWDRMENLLDKYGIKPLIGIIPNCQDPTMVSIYEQDLNFAKRISSWIKKGYTLALHGNTHVYSTVSGGINPVNNRSEFAGLSLAEQESKIKEGMATLKEMYNIVPKVFFAPSHTFDDNTLIALKKCSEIRNISDTIANDSYQKNGFTFVPVQSGVVRNLPFNTITFCYHPNTMNDDIAWDRLESFLSTNSKYFISYEDVMTSNRNLNIIDKIYSWLYFFKKRFLLKTII